MAKFNFKSVDDYIDAQPDAVRLLLERVRSAIRKAVPEAEELISYNLPGYKLRGKPMIYFAAWKQHYAVYPATANLSAEFKDDLAQLEVDKSTIRFPFSKPAPVKLIGRLAKFRATEVAKER